MSARLNPENSGFGPTLIVRDRPLRFRLDGFWIEGFEGDSILSALLAAGIDCAGMHNKMPLALGPEFAPYLRNRSEPQGDLFPMHLCPAKNGMDLTTIGAPSRPLSNALRRIGRRLPTSLGVDFDHAHNQVPEPYAHGDNTYEPADVLVIGGGISGLTAAIAAAEAGGKTILIERRFCLGGDAHLFGNRDGEPPVQELVGDLITRAHSCAGLDIRLGHEAVHTANHRVQVVSVSTKAGRPAAVRHEVAAKKVVFATGCADRLPVLPGNRLPGVVGLATAFHLAAAYAIWPGETALVAGGVNSIYRLAVLAQEAGKQVTRILDIRLDPHSRFLDFSKAFGIPQVAATRLAHIGRGDRGSLEAQTMLFWKHSPELGDAALRADRIVVSDGWRPRLTLWGQAGGDMVWTGRGGDAVVKRGPKEVALVGSAAGYLTNAGCMASAKVGLAALDGARPHPIVEDLLSVDFESADAKISPPIAGGPSGSAYLSGGWVFATAPEPKLEKRGLIAKAWLATEPEDDLFGRLDAAALDALVIAGRVAEVDYNAIAQERLTATTRLCSATTEGQSDTAAEFGVADYLVGRFGPNAVRQALTSEDGRHFAAGMLIYADTERSDPGEAVGVILAASETGGAALIAAAQANPGTGVVVRDGRRALRAWISDSPN